MPIVSLSAARKFARPAAHLSRELAAVIKLTRSTGSDPLAFFLPSAGRTGAALLRIYNIAELCPKHGWRAFVVPPNLSLAARRRLIAMAKPDVLVMQGARHLLNRPHLYPGHSIVFDMDDADFHLPHLEAPLKRAMPNVATVVAGSDYIGAWCRQNGAPNTQTLLTGMPVSRTDRPPHNDRPPVVAWAQTRPMNYHREAAFVLDVMKKVTRDCRDARLRLFDRRPEDSEVFLEPFLEAGIAVDWCPAVSLQEYLSVFDDVALGLAPLSLEMPFSRGKSVGKVLAYMDRHVPVIASDAGEHRRVFGDGTGILSNDPEVWVSQARALLASPEKRQNMAERAFDFFQQSLSAEAVAERFVGILDTHLRDSRQIRHLSLPE